MPAAVPVTPDVAPAATWVPGRTGSGGVNTLASTKSSTNPPMRPCSVVVVTVATTQAPTIVPGTRPVMIHPSPVRSSAWCSCRNIAMRDRDAEEHDGDRQRVRQHEREHRHGHEVHAETDRALDRRADDRRERSEDQRPTVTSISRPDRTCSAAPAGEATPGPPRRMRS